jgi:hypothetical protein
MLPFSDEMVVVELAAKRYSAAAKPPEVVLMVIPSRVIVSAPEAVVLLPVVVPGTNVTVVSAQADMVSRATKRRENNFFIKACNELRS